jgi:hypothetical protein
MLYLPFLSNARRVLPIPNLSQRASTIRIVPYSTVRKISRSSGRKSPYRRQVSVAAESMTATPQTWAMDRANRTRLFQSSSSARPKLWIILATVVLVSGLRSLCASWRYSVTVPFLFYLFVVRKRGTMFASRSM